MTPAAFRGRVIVEQKRAGHLFQLPGGDPLILEHAFFVVEQQLIKIFRKNFLSKMF